MLRMLAPLGNWHDHWFCNMLFDCHCVVAAQFTIERYVFFERQGAKITLSQNRAKRTSFVNNYITR